jgi:hypothetical protein
MFALSGKIVKGRDSTIQLRSLKHIAAKVEAGSFGPNTQSKPSQVFESSPKFDDLMAGRWESLGYDSQSEADLALCIMLAKKHGGDWEKIEQEFGQSGLCGEKWKNRKGYRKSTIKKAVECAVNSTVRVLDKTAARPAYKYPARPWRTFQYVLGPTDSNTTPGLFSRSKSRRDGWLSRGQTNIVAGSSGAGKTRWLLPTLLEASRRGTVHGHPGQGLRFAVIFADRGRIGNAETIESLGLNPQDLDIRHMPVVWGKAATDFIQHELERKGPDQMPDVLFIEGADLLVEDPNKAQVVAPFLSALNALAEHYNAAIILSLGAGKKSNEAFSSRDRAFGSVMWQRMSAQMFILTRPAEDSEDKYRTLTVNHRNWRPEKIDLQFTDDRGRLIEYKQEQKEEAAMTKSKQALLSFIEEHEGETFTAKQARDASRMNGSDLKSALSGYVAIGRLKTLTKGSRISYKVMPVL